MLHINEYSDKLKKELEKGEKVFEGLIDKYFLQNNHLLKLILRPDENLANKKNQQEFARLNNKKKNLTKEIIEQMKNDTKDLLEHQNQVQDLDVLPTITIDDIPKKVEEVKTNKFILAHGTY